MTWEIASWVKQALVGIQIPEACPPDRLFVPPDLRGQVIHWGHASSFSCHPGVRRTVFIISKRFWWPAMEKEVGRYVAACDICARCKVSRTPPAGLPHPLPIPTRPWADISLDFVTGLPSSDGSTNILTLVDRFSKMVHFVPLPKLPSARETAEALLNA